MTPMQFTIRGMDCAEEVAILKREIGPIVGGVDRLGFDILNARMTVTDPASGITADDVARAVAATGMTADVYSENEPAREESRWQRWERTVLTAASGGLLLAAFASHGATVGSLVEAFKAETVPTFSKFLYLAAALAGVWQVLPKAWAAIRRLRPDMNVLMVVAVAGAVTIGEWFEAATVAFLFSVSLLLESWSVGRARRAVAALLELAPTRVRVKNIGHEEERSPGEVNVGDVFVVRPGEKVPLDGEIVVGTTSVNQAPITGESRPVPKEPGDTVFAGTVNGDGAIEVRSTKPATETTLAQIVRLVQAAQSRRAPSEQWVERLARVYTPTVMGIALAVALLPPLLLGGLWSTWVFRALVLLVIACPCALVISTPVTIVAALAAAARNGVLVKGGTFIEAPARLRVIAFDKTGTLTKGEPSVVEVRAFSGHTESELLGIAASLEALSPHPLAKAILAKAKLTGVTATPASEVKVVPGKGLTGTVDGRPHWLGSHRYLHDRGVVDAGELHDALERFAARGHTVMVVGSDEHVCGVIALADTLRPNAKQTLADLRALGIERLVLLSGDNKATADAVGTELGIDEVRADLLPADKVTAIEELVAKYGTVAMIGDGVNDAPALGRATLGIAMGVAGTDAAIESADVALMSDDLSRLPWLVRHSAKAISVVRQNVAFSLLIKLSFLVLTVAGYATMWGAIAADAGASLVVVANGLRLLKVGSSED